MQLTAESIDIGTRRPIVLLHRSDAGTLGVRPLDRVEIYRDGETTIGIVKVTDDLLEPGRIGVTHGLPDVSGPVEVLPAPHPESVSSIRRKLDGIELDGPELATIVADIHGDRLSDVELAAYVTGNYVNGLSLAETTQLTEHMIEAGERLSWDVDVVVDKHSIGGVAGNRVTPILVSIVAAAGLTIPKTSSRAVTSPAGTADTMEVFSPVEFSRNEIRRIVGETGGCVVWGGAVDLSPVDDEMIRAQSPLSLDPPGQVIASVLSKKVSAGSTHVVVEIPYGEGAKVSDIEEARDLAADFEHVGAHFDLELECAITRGSEPVGCGIGPVLEARDILEVLEGEGPDDLRRKSIGLADVLFELVADETDVGPGSARELLDSGAALETFRDIVSAQGGNPDVTTSDLEPGPETETVSARRSGVVTDVSNTDVNRLAWHAGAPGDRGAGLYIHRCVGEEVSVGDDLYTIYAETDLKLERAVDYAEGRTIVNVADPGEVLIERF